MEKAHDYARAAMADPQRQIYFQQQAKKQKKCAYRLAFGHYFKTLEENEG